MKNRTVIVLAIVSLVVTAGLTWHGLYAPLSKEAAGKKYLELVAPLNKEVETSRALGTVSESNLTAKKAAAGKIADAERVFAEKLAEVRWPEATSPHVQDLIKDCALDVTAYRAMQKATSVDAYKAASAGKSSSASAEAVRLSLGLPDVR